MKLSKNSKKLILLLKNSKHINQVKQSPNTISVLHLIYNDIMEAYNYLNKLKRNDKNYYDIHIKKINSSYEITKPQNFNVNSFPEMVRKQIDELAQTEITYRFSIFGRTITVYFILEETNNQINIKQLNTYIDNIILWLYILNQYASKHCSSSLKIYFYFTSLEKHLPKSNINILDEININTAFTTSCPKDAEVVVFRKEEWFKVFIHETFHSFGLDFSDMNNYDTTRCILNIFKVNSEVNLYESYTEFWAEIINALFCSFLSLTDKNNVNDFLSTSQILINFERTYSFFQLVKTLNFMDLKYKDLYSKTEHSRLLRENLYKEKTSVLSYYIIKTILINNYQSFLLWCKNNNLSILQFKKTILNQSEYCKFIEKNYKTKSMLDGVKYAEDFLYKMNKNKKQNSNYLLTNMRMSICELG
jgi:hypothetical protein